MLTIFGFILMCLSIVNRVLIDNQYMFERRMISCCISLDFNNYQKNTLIVMTSRYFDEFRKTPDLLPTIWHEIGHFHTMHYFDTHRDERGSVLQVRTNYCHQREIMPEEKVADLFALYYTSQEDMLRWFDYLIKRRRKNTYETFRHKCNSIVAPKMAANR